MNYIGSYYLGSTSKVIGCVSSEATILKCLEEKNERFEKIYLNVNDTYKI